jgi:hypothetical protein
VDRNPEPKLPASVSRVDFPIEIAQIRQSVHRQAVFVRFALDDHFHQMPGQPFAGAFGLGTVCECAVYAQRAIDGQTIHWISRESFSVRVGKARCPESFLKNFAVRDAILGAKLHSLVELVVAAQTNQFWRVARRGGEDVFIRFIGMPACSLRDKCPAAVANDLSKTTGTNCRCSGRGESIATSLTAPAYRRSHAFPSTARLCLSMADLSRYDHAVS